MQILLYVFLSMFFINQSLAKPFSWESGTKKAHLIELFTSESCSSCPPAEKWLNKLKSHPGLFKTIVPVEFHVNYWNHLHWKDPFSKQKYTDRQRAYASLHGTKTIFTPQILLNGKTNLRSHSPYPKANNNKAPNLKISYYPEVFKLKLKIESNKTSEFICEAAFLGGNFSNKIPVGENSGKTLSHEFVALNLESSLSKNKNCNFQFKKHSNYKNKSIAVWIKDLKTKEILQATGYSFIPNNE